MRIQLPEAHPSLVKSQFPRMGPRICIFQLPLVSSELHSIVTSVFLRRKPFGSGTDTYPGWPLFLTWEMEMEHYT